MHERFGSDVRFLGVAGRDDLAAIEEFVDVFTVDGFDHLVDSDGAIWAAYEIFTQPSFAFLDDSGIVETHIGPLGEEGLSERIELLLAQ